MSSVLIPVLYGLAGVCVYAAVHHALFAWRQPANRAHLWFALMCAMIAAYVAAKAGAYQAGSAQALVEQRRWEIAFALLLFTAFPWFVREYVGRGSLWPPLGLSLIMGAVLMANLLLPFGVVFTDHPDFARLTLPWGEQVTDLRVHQGGMWYHIGRLGMLLVFIYSLNASWQQYRRGEKHRALTLAIAIAVFLVFFLFNQLVNQGIVDFIHTAEFGFLGLLFVMNQSLTRETRRVEKELNDLRHQVLHADRVERIGVLSTSLAHELSQPLTAVLSNAQAGLRFMQQGEPALDELRDILEDIVRDDERAIAIIRGLRAMLRQKSTTRERIVLAEAVAEALDLMHDEILRRGARYERDLQHNCHVLADKVQIEQVILNLVMNALDALDARPAGQRQLRISVASDGDGQARVVVRDSGMGLPPSQVDRIFESFYT
ncbi:MAG TPA: ATP-binding protein, partial [Gammaproteobacteria bacterium]|nr:ATP-binding protein [Gammaproteobacteria bacterium]